MENSVNWLPELEFFASYDGDWEKYLHALYAIFHADFVASKPSYQGVRLGLKRHPMIQGKEATFWHIISTGDNEEDRVPDFRRCERIRWPKPLIENVPNDDIKVWTERRNSEDRIHLWLESEGYLLVLNKRRDYLLWTAFYVEKQHQRDKYKKRWERYKGI
ncbi:MAG: hypothetical protein IBX52_07640 [Bacterioplanes sp.]|nr:hypothetical protein [Bacterioplanes sp.]